MRILQLIDSLDAGGAERMAVNYANALAGDIDFSGLIATRKQGDLLSKLQHFVSYQFLNKKKAIDLKAIIALRSYCKMNKIDVVHAHGTSFFTAFLLKLVTPSIKIIWHEHLGSRTTHRAKDILVLRFCSRFFAGIIVVNHELKDWCTSNLSCNNVLYLPNFTKKDDQEEQRTFLAGTLSKRILLLANLKHPKNHRLLLEVAVKLKKTYPDWTFHLVGKDAYDDYSMQVRSFIKEHQLEETVYLYGLREDTNFIVQQATIGVLTSSSEGLPVALLEYGAHKKAVVATDVGEISEVLDNGVSGYVVPLGAINQFYEALVELINSPDLAAKFGNRLHQFVLDHHSEKLVIENYLNWLKTV